MSCCANTIARALALVTVGTAAAFTHWAADPPRLTLGGPEDIADPAPEPAPLDPAIADPGQTPDGPIDAPPLQPVQPDGEHADDPQPGATPGPFNPDALGTEIGTPEAHELWRSGAVAFIDARPQKDYLAGHIPYAYLIPAETIADGRLGDMMDLGGVDPSMRVVVYCEGGTCDASHLVALTLQDMGFTKIHIDTDGFPGWQDAGHEVETGSDTVLGDVP